MNWRVPESIGGLLLVLALAGYVAGVHRHRDRGPWPRYRTALWISGLVCVGVAWTGPLAAAARSGFTAHMGTHLLLGMLGPLLLVLTHPVVAAVLNAGGLWILYTTDLYSLMHQSMAVHVLVHAHILLAGLAFTVAIIGPDPNPHRAGFRTRAAVLVLFIAAHSILGRWLYGYPPVGVDPADARAGAQLMFYGGEVIDLTLLVLLFAGWYPGSRRPGRWIPRNPSRDHHAGRPGGTRPPGETTP